MNNNPPVLLLGYNRPEQMSGLIKSLEPYEPALILFAVDGPRLSKSGDIQLVKQTQETVNLINWKAEVHLRLRNKNLGLRNAVVDSVSWACSEYGRVIVLEDDVRAGPQLLNYLTNNLNKYESSNQIAHISGYNLVPIDHISRPNQRSRLSIYPESYAWATWDRAWEKYDDDLTWAKSASIREFSKICGSNIAAIRWKQNFADAAAELIDTWAYRWIASIWANNMQVVSPNRNIAMYMGGEGGTHTRRQIKWSELAVEKLPDTEFDLNIQEIDFLADEWLAKNIFRSTMSGIIEGRIVSEVLAILKKVSRR